MGRRWRFPLIAVVVLIVCGGAGAQVVAASTVTVFTEGAGPWGGIDYRAAPGESNRVQITFVGADNDNTIRVTDGGAFITPGDRCRAIDAHTAECSTKGIEDGPRLISARVEAGDMNDVVTSKGPGLSANGGSGDDVLDVTSLAAGLLNGGGGGHDTLLGSSNTDTLIDGDRSGAADSDILDGREGGDMVSYAGRTAPVRVDLTSPGSAAGEAGEGDVLRSIDSIIGGLGPDVLQGNAGANRFESGAGADRVRGLAGRDFIVGGSGDDALFGGRGEDRLEGESGSDRLSGGADDDIFHVRRGGPDSVACGPGRADFVIDPNSRDTLAPDCESAFFNFGAYADDQVRVDAYPHRQTKAYVVLRVDCPGLEALDGESDRISGRVSLRETFGRRRLVGAGRIPAALGRRCRYGPTSVPVRVVFNSRGRMIASNQRDASLTVSLSGRNLPRASWTIRLTFR